MKKLVVATANMGKVREVASMLTDLPVEVLYLADYPDIPAVEETGSTFAENACIKALAYAEYTGEVVIADDSGLEVDALGGAPGVYSSRFADTDSARITKLLDMLRDTPKEDRTARFRCAIALCVPGEQPQTVEDSVEGLIIEEQRGSGGFGYDPVFYIGELNKTMSELEPEEKNAISHRGKALRKAMGMLKEALDIES